MASRFPPRDRSPPRYSDRRPPPHPHPSRGPDDANSTPLGREPPRGPKALVDSPRGGHFGSPASRGRGFGGRGDFRDRDRDRDPRDSREAPPPFRRDADRDRSRRDRGFDTREGRGPYGRGRSRSPLPLRDFRDSRDVPPRDADVARPRRNSRDGPIGPGPPVVEPSSFRGGLVRGRGRGDRERGRGRGAPPADDRDSFRRRSRSRDSWRERERDRDNERRDRFESRWEDDRRSERDERERPLIDRSEPWKELKQSEMPPPPSFLPSSSSPAISGTQSKITSDDQHDTARKALPNTPGQRRVLDRHESLPSFLEKPSDDRPSQQFSPPPSAPEVPAFGSISKLINDVAAPTGTSSETKQPSAESGVVKPPTGPKADRLDTHDSADFRQGRRHSQTELSLRTSKAPSSPETTRQDQFDRSAQPPTPSSRPGRSPSRPKTPDTAPQRSSRPPTGPRPKSSGSSTAATHSLVRRPSSSGRDGSPPHQPNRAPLESTAGLPFGSVPTAPRALQRSGPPRGGARAGNQWSRPGYLNQSPAGPAAASSVPPEKREAHNDNDDFIKSAATESWERSDEERKEYNEEAHGAAHPEGEQAEDAEAGIIQSKKISDAQHTAESQQSGEPFLFAESSGEESDEEDALDEEDFNRSEERFKKEIQSLQAQIPPPLLKDPVMVGLLLKIQMLTMIAEGAMPPYLDLPGAAMEIERPHQPSAILPLSSKDAKDIDLSEVPPSNDTKPPEAPVDLRPSVESLPFLQSGPPTPFSDMESFQETLKSHEQVKDALREVLGKQQAETFGERERLRKEYAQYYKPWRAEVADMDRKREESKPKLGTGPSTPPPPPPVANPPPVLEGGRRGMSRLNSELDFQNALRASEITAEEESARRRDKEASSAKPDMTKEAPIPDMLSPKAREAAVFQDTNQIIDTADALKVFGFCPPPNDFTPTEHKMFTDAFMEYPKKWGKIAESLPGRTFQQCVTHYYLTKEEIKYKAKLNRRWTSRKGRGRKAVRPAKTNALMSDLGAARREYDGAPDVDQSDAPAITDTGRPRRAAAPTFGDSNDATAESTAPTPNSSGKRGNNQGRDTGTNGSDGTNNGDSKQMTTVSRRGGRGGGAGRGGRRQKAAQQQQQQQQQQQPPQPVTAIAAAPPKQELGLPPGKDLTAPTAAGPVVKENNDLDKDVSGYGPRAKTNRGRTKEPPPQGQFGAGASAAGTSGLDHVGAENFNDNIEGPYGSSQPTSYWSVNEVRDFPDLISHYGKDFVAISQFMKTKTPTMAKNYFQRQISSGKTELEELAVVAETKKLRGEPTGPLPTPSAIPPKRRYEATPSAIGPRPLAPNTDSEGADRSLAPKGKAAAASNQGVVGGPTNIQARPSVERERIPPRYQPLAPQAAAAAAGSVVEEGHSQSMHSQAAPPPQRAQQGPRMGYFSDDRRDIRQHIIQEPIDIKQHPSTLGGMHVQHGMGGITAAPDTPRRNIVSRHQDAQEPVRYQPMPPQSTGTFGQTAYVHAGQPPMATATSPHGHSRRTSRTISTSGASPLQQHLQPPSLKVETDHAGHAPELLSKPVSSYLPSGPISEMGRSPSVAPPQPPSNEPSRSSSTPAQPVAEPPSQIPAKRSNRLNIMSILNEEPEEPQPRKRFAGEQSPGSAKGPGGFAQPRPVYSGPQGTSQQPMHPPEAPQHRQYAPSGTQAPSPMQQQPHLQQHPSQQQLHSQAEHVRRYHEQPQQQPPPQPPQQRHSSFSAAPGPRGAANQDWLDRFDPRGPQQTQQQATPATSSSADHQLPRLSTQQQPGPAYGVGSATQQSPGHSATVEHQQQQQNQRPPLQHQPLPSSRQTSSIHTQGHQLHGSRGSGGRESPPTGRPLQAYHPGTGSPVQRHHNIPYSMGQPRPEPGSPAQTPIVGPGHSQYHHQQHSGPVGGYASDTHHHGQNQQQQHQPPSAAGQLLGPHSAHERHNSSSYVHGPSRHQLSQQEQPPVQPQRRSSLGNNSLAQPPPQSQHHPHPQPPNAVPPPFSGPSPAPSHVQPILRHNTGGGPAPSSGGAPQGLLTARPYSPASQIHHHHSHSQSSVGSASGGGMTYANSGPQPLQASPAPAPQGLAPQHQPAHPLHIQPRQPGGPPLGGHHGYQHDPPR